MTSWRPEVQVTGEDGFHSNGLRFATRAEAEAYVSDLMWRWMMVTKTRVVVSDDAANYTWTDQGRAERITP